MKKTMTTTQKIKALIELGKTNEQIIDAVPKATMQQVYNQRYWAKKKLEEKGKEDTERLIRYATKEDMKPPIRMQAQPQSILDEAREIIYGDREKTYGSPDKNLCAIAGYWSNHLLTRFGVHHEITGADVCIMMTLLKAARLGNDLTHRDSLVDAAGYLALLERIQK
jgi:hypothetical protein